MAAAMQAQAEEKAAVAAASTVQSRAAGTSQQSVASSVHSNMPENIQGKAIQAPVTDEEVHANVSEVAGGDISADQGRRSDDN